MVTIPTIPVEYLQTLKLKGLTGRVLELPYEGEGVKTPILLIYGHHSSLERMLSTAEAFRKYGAVTVPDLPGFGAMPSLTTINQEPNINNLADYLAEFIRQRYPNGQKFILEGLSLGFVISVRMLQRHPELQSQVSHLVSIVGFAKADDFTAPAAKRQKLARLARILARKAPAALFAGLILRKPLIGSIYHMRARSHPKMKGYSWQERQDLITFETTLWQTNEVRTYFTTAAEMLTLDLTTQPVPMPVEHIGTNHDQYLDNQKIAAHLAEIFTKVRTHEAILPNHVPTVLEDTEAANALIPHTLLDIFGVNK